MHKYRHNKKYSGFTLIELMLVIAIGGILASFAMPAYDTMINNNCLTTKTNSLVASFNLARSTAIKHKTEVTMTASSATTTDEWGTGWTITLDEDRNGNGALDAGEDYDADGALDNAISVRNITTSSCTQTTLDETTNGTATSGATATGDSIFVYESDGFIDAAGTFDVCDGRVGETGRQITISNTGRVNTNSAYMGCT